MSTATLLIISVLFKLEEKNERGDLICIEGTLRKREFNKLRRLPQGKRHVEIELCIK